MSTITLEEIETRHTELGVLIEQFKKQSEAIEYRIDGITIPLAACERFAGMVLNDDGTIKHYLIKLAGEVEEIAWADARKWAEEQGGTLPTRQEQALLYANLKSEFASAWYWSDEKYVDDDEPDEESAFAWFTTFNDGSQHCSGRYGELRAVAVRRFIPSVI